MRCVNCNSKNIFELYKFKDYGVFECEECRLKFSHPPKVYDYEKNYFTKEHKRYFASCKEGYNINDPKIKNFKRGIEEIEKKTSIGKILDIGCATGVFLDICKKRGWECYGLDISKYATNYAHKKFGIKTRSGSLMKAKYLTRFFDVVTMWDFIEHLDDPLKILKESKRILKKNGVLFIATINEDSLMNKTADFIYRISLGFIKKPVALLHPEQHLTHFSESVLIKILKKMDFEIIYTKNLELPINNIEGGVLKDKIIEFFYFLQKIFNRKYVIWIIGKKS